MSILDDIDMDDMTTDELFELVEILRQEAAERKSREAFDRSMGEKIKEARDGGLASTPEWGDEYVIPKSLVHSYMVDEVVSHDGILWKSNHNANVCVPQDQVPPPKGCGSWDRLPDDDYPSDPGYQDEYTSEYEEDGESEGE